MLCRILRQGCTLATKRKRQIRYLAAGGSLLFQTLLPVNIEGVRCEGDETQYESRTVTDPPPQT